MKVNIYTDKNLMSYLAKGWSEDKLVAGKIKTLTGRTFSVDGVEDNWTIFQLKRALEDQEGILSPFPLPPFLPSLCIFPPLSFPFAYMIT
jgi:hypothetical protein